ncbi:hypothetical protein ACJMQP_25675 [Rhodopseudomonas palustris]
MAFILFEGSKPLKPQPINNMQQLRQRPRRTLTDWEHQAGSFSVPTEGMTVDAYAAAIAINPLEADEAVSHLHRKKIIWRQVRRGHSVVFPADHRPTRGRPRTEGATTPVDVDPRLYRLFIKVAPAAIGIAMLKSKLPDSHWTDRIQLKTDLRRSIAVESANIVSIFRRFVSSNDIGIETVREFLWLVFPSVMQIAVETQPELHQGAKPLEARLPSTRKRLQANLSAEDRVLAYVDAAGWGGIAAYEISRKTAGKMTREDVLEIGYRLSDTGLIYDVDNARSSGRGRRGPRFFSREFGRPEIGSGGQRRPNQSMSIDIRPIVKPWLDK